MTHSTGRRNSNAQRHLRPPVSHPFVWFVQLVLSPSAVVSLRTWPWSPALERGTIIAMCTGDFTLRWVILKITHCRWGDGHRITHCWSSVCSVDIQKKKKSKWVLLTFVLKKTELLFTCIFYYIHISVIDKSEEGSLWNRLFTFLLQLKGEMWQCLSLETRGLSRS